ncbi:MAG: DUF4417 domain-containing protein, partial [Eubacterium sp.]|nr:DUF4417 domain-containing protein [Eubacterium sp.]
MLKEAVNKVRRRRRRRKSRAIGYFFQKNRVYVIPCVRWGDERTYTTRVLPEKVAFLGVEKQRHMRKLLD